jgi:hypothetical protein
VIFKATPQFLPKEELHRVSDESPRRASLFWRRHPLRPEGRKDLYPD